MKKTLLTALVALATLGTAAAQTKMAPVAAGQTPATPVVGTIDMSHGKGHGHGKGPKTPEQKADRRAGKMAKELGLTADQEAKVEALLLAENKEMQALRGTAAPRTPGTRPAPGQAAEMKAVRERYNGQLKGILSPEQYAKLLAKRSEKREEMKAKRGGQK